MQIADELSDEEREAVRTAVGILLAVIRNDEKGFHRLLDPYRASLLPLVDGFSRLAVEALHALSKRSGILEEETLRALAAGLGA